jgi:hypothetical protein
MSLSDWQDDPHADVRFFNAEEQRRIAKFKIPGDTQQSWGSAASYYPRKPIESPRKWFQEHAEKLRALERAAR